MTVASRKIWPWAVAVMALGHASSAENLLPHSDFAGADPQANVEEGWRWDSVRAPSDFALSDDGSVTLTGGKGFLRSPSFPTRQDSALSYVIGADVHGRGAMRIEMIWWNRNRKPASPHVEVALHEHALSEDPQRIEATAHPEGGAVFGQVRFVQSSEDDDGLLVIRSPSVEITERYFEPGLLLLALDAADPGDAPQKQWEDLTGLNRPFQVIGAPVNDPASGVYRIAGRDDYFEGAAEDETRFDFDTAKAAGRSQPFTAVVYSSLDGPSYGAFINKLDLRKSDPETGVMLDAPGWMLNLTWGEFNQKQISVHQMLNNTNERIISRHGGNDGSSLDVQPGDMHLYVVHVPGDGIAGNIQVFVDGRKIPEPNFPWAGGGLPDRSIQNDVPLRIGGGLPFLAKGHPHFTGAIGFIEIWTGRGLLEGMPPERYGAYRWNNGDPVRGLITGVK